MIYLMLLPLLLALSASAQPSETGFLQRKVTLGNSAYCYQVFVPQNYSPKKNWPVLLFLHGAGERGSDCNEQTETGLGPALRGELKNFPGVVVMPQCRAGALWHGEMEQQALQALEQSIEEFHGDRARVYLTGISMGGYGTYYFAGHHPGKFAALVPICGGVVPPRHFSFPPEVAAQIPKDKPYETIAKQIGKTPVWIFHGSVDYTIPVSESHNMNAALRALGNPVKYTEYAGVGHNSWDRAYAEKELWTWLLAQKLSTARSTK